MIIAAILCFLLFGLLLVYPYVIYPALLSLLPSKPIERDPEHRLSGTLVFCAFNEGAAMPEKLNNIAKLKSRHPDLEVLAFDDGSTDDTYDQLAMRQDLLTVVRGDGRSGKASGMKRLAALAKGEILIFTDANVLLREDAIENLCAWYADQSVGGICGSLKYIGADESTTALVGGAYWRLEERLKSEESRTGNVMGADGSIFSIRRDLYPSFPDTVLDDLTVSMAVVFAGKRLIKVEDVVAFEKLISVRKEEFSRKIRIAARAYHTHLHLKPQLRSMRLSDRFKYFSRKVVRWFGGVFLLLAVLTLAWLTFIVSVSAGVLFCFVFVLLLLLGGKTHSGLPGAVAEISLALIATLIGVVRAMRGQTFVVWAPAKSR